MSKKKKAKKQQRDANPAKVAAKLVEVGEMKKGVRQSLAKADLPDATRKKLAKTERRIDKGDRALQHEFLMAISPGYAREQERREAEAARAA